MYGFIRFIFFTKDKNNYRRQAIENYSFINIWKVFNLLIKTLVLQYRYSLHAWTRNIHNLFVKKKLCGQSVHLGLGKGVMRKYYGFNVLPNSSIISRVQNAFWTSPQTDYHSLGT